MSIGTIVNVMRSGIFQIFILILPVLSAALIIGLIVAIFLLSGWMFSELRDYTVKLFEIIPELAK